MRYATDWFVNYTINVYISLCDSMTDASCRIRSDSQTTGLPVADNLINEDGQMSLTGLYTIQLMRNKWSMTYILPL